MKVLLVFLWRIWFVILGLALSIVLGPWIYILSFSDTYHKRAYQLMRIWCKGMFYGMGFSYELIKETTKMVDNHKQYIIIANHTSVIDVFLPSAIAIIK